MARDIEILLVEPHSVEAQATAAILKKARVRNHVTVAANGAQAMAYLVRRGSHRAPRPNLILLSGDDLPDRGQSLLDDIKSDGHLLHIPVVFMSASESDTDIRAAYDHDANCYVQKPLDGEQMNRVLETTREFWLAIAKLPFD